MALTIVPQFTSGKSDGADATKVQPSNWNATRVFQGGTDGDLFYYDSTQTSHINRITIVAAGQVLVSGTIPAWSASPSVTSLTASTSVSSPLFQSTGTVIFGQAGQITDVKGATVRISNSAGQVWTFDNGSGYPLIPTTTNSYDIGSAAATVRTGYFGTSVSSPIFLGSSASVSTQFVTSDQRVGMVAFSSTHGTPNIIDFYTANLVRMSISAAGSWTLATVGPHAIGGAIDSTVQLYLRGTSTANTALFIQSALTGAVGSNMAGIAVVPALTTAASGTHAILTLLRLQAPTVTSGGATVTNTASLYIDGAISATVSGANYAAWIASGAIRFDGTIQSGANVGIDASITTAALVGKTITVSKGIITGFA